jgi:hypothetical protein
MDKNDTSNTNTYPKKEEEKTIFVLQLEKILTFVIGLLISSLIFCFFGIAIGGILGGENGAEIGIVIGLILAVGFSVVMLSKKDFVAKEG